MKLISLITTIILSFNSFGNNCDENSSKAWFELGNKKVLIHQSVPLDDANHSIDTAIISLHGTLRNGSEYFKDMCESIGSEVSHTLVLSPTFKEKMINSQKGRFSGDEDGIKKEMEIRL